MVAGDWTCHHRAAQIGFPFQLAAALSQGVAVMIARAEINQIPLRSRRHQHRVVHVDAPDFLSILGIDAQQRACRMLVTSVVAAVTQAKEYSMARNSGG